MGTVTSSNGETPTNTGTLPGSRTNKEITEHSYPTALHIQVTEGATSPCMAISITRRKIKGWLSHIWTYQVVWVTVQIPIGNGEGNSLVLFWYGTAIFSDMLIMAVSCGIHRRRHHRSISPFSTSGEVEKSPATALAEAPQCLQSPGSQGPKKQVCVLVVCVFKSALLCVQYHNLCGSGKLAPSDLRLKKQIWTPKMCCPALSTPQKKKIALQHVFNRDDWNPQMHQNLLVAGHIRFTNVPPWKTVEALDSALSAASLTWRHKS